jgi:hypothetical protein
MKPKLYLLSKKNRFVLDGFFDFILKEEGFSVAGHLVMRGDEIFYYSSNPDWENYYVEREFFKKCLVLEDLKKKEKNTFIVYSAHQKYLEDPITQARFSCCDVTNGVTLSQKNDSVVHLLFLGWKQKNLSNEGMIEKIYLIQKAQHFFKSFHFINKKHGKL